MSLSFYANDVKLSLFRERAVLSPEHKKRNNEVGVSDHRASVSRSDRSFKWLRRSIVGIALLAGMASAAHPDADATVKGVVWTVTVFGLSLFAPAPHFRERWFWKGIAIAVVVHCILLFTLLPFFAEKSFFLMYAPIVGELLMFLLIFAKVDPKHGEEWQ